MAEFGFDEEAYIVGMHDRGVLAFPEGGLRLKSGRISPYYHNQRRVLSHNRNLALSGVMSIARQVQFQKNLAEGYAQRFTEIKRPFRHVFGKAQAATAPLGVAAFVAEMSYLWERVPEPGKERYGMHAMIEGDYEYGDFVHLGDDNTTDGQSKIDGAGVLYRAGLQPVSLTVAFDREEGARERLEQLGFEMNAVTSLSKAIPVLRDSGRIGNQQVEAVQAYHEDLKNSGITTTFQLAA